MSTPVLPEEDRPLRLDVIAEWLGVAVKTVRRLIDSGKLKSVKIGGLRMVLVRDFKAYLKGLNGEDRAHV
jgi:excisionase family DNA binding protein